MSKQIMVRQKQRLGGDRFVRATVLAERGDTLRVVLVDSNKPIEIKRADTIKAPEVTRGPVQRAIPDSRNSLCSILEQRGF